MRNRAKCKLCKDIIESFHRYDYVECKCREISVDGGDTMYKAGARDFNNFLRIDDDGNEIIVSVQDETIENKMDNIKPNREELLDMLDMMIKNYSDLPPQAMSIPITHYDLSSALLLISSILRSH